MNGHWKITPLLHHHNHHILFITAVTFHLPSNLHFLISYISQNAFQPLLGELEV